MGYWGWYPKAKKRRPADGIRAKTERGQFGKTWWAGRWIAALERLVNPARLARGRTYARVGQVVSLDVSADGVKASVQGSVRDANGAVVPGATIKLTSKENNKTQEVLWRRLEQVYLHRSRLPQLRQKKPKWFRAGSRAVTAQGLLGTFRFPPVRRPAFDFDPVPVLKRFGGAGSWEAW